MKHAFPWLRFLLPAGLALVTTGAAADAPDFSRFQVILDRKPFGDVPLPPAGPDPSTIPAAPPAFLKTLRLSGLYERDGRPPRVGLMDLQSKKSYIIGVGESEDGIEVVSASYESEEAVIRKDGQTASLQLQSVDAKPVTPEDLKARVAQAQPTPTAQLSYAERRRIREEVRTEVQKPPEPPPKPKYTGEELAKHLQDYQMEVIRQGLPPLPIPLTPDQDAQLVAEGVLPAAEPTAPTE